MEVAGRPRRPCKFSVAIYLEGRLPSQTCLLARWLSPTLHPSLTADDVRHTLACACVSTQSIGEQAPRLAPLSQGKLFDVRS